MDNRPYRDILQRLLDHHTQLRDTYLQAQLAGMSFQWDNGNTIQDRIDKEDLAVRNLKDALAKAPK